MAKQDVALAQALFRAQRFSWAEYVFYASVWIEGVHEGRLMDGTYKDVLGPVLRRIDAAEAVDGPDESALRIANDEYERLADSKFSDICDELGASDIGVLWRTKRAEYDELRERGRRFVHHADQFDLALRDIIDETYAAAERTAEIGEYRAAVTLLGASLEGLLLQRCLRSATRARLVAAKLPSRIRPKPGRPIGSWTFETLIEVCEHTGWLPRIASQTGVLSAGGLAHSVREMRNWIHPSREARNRPWKGVFGPDYELAHALYTLVKTALKRPRSLRLNSREHR